MRLAPTLPSSSISRVRLGARGLCVEQLAGRPVLGLERLSHGIAPSESPARTPAMIARPVASIKHTPRKIPLQCAKTLSFRQDHVKAAATKIYNPHGHGLKPILPGLN